jgi:UDP-N-acetylmuramate--alanine ligase
MFRRFVNLEHAHFVGIGGAGMSGIAEILAQYELTVTGCDVQGDATSGHLSALGIPIARGHSPEHLDGVDLLVVSSAIPKDLPEVEAARERGIPVVRRAEMLAELMRLKFGIGVAGTHGKTTTTSLVGTLLTEGGLDPTVIVGGRLRLSGTGARLGHSDYMVVEADEFDRSFLQLSPIVAIITNIDRDHLDTYGTLEAIEDAFVSFASRVPFFGQIVACLDDRGVQRILPRLASRRVVTYGLEASADLRAEGLKPEPSGTHFELVSRNAGRLGEFFVPLAGPHNVRNALAALAVGLGLGLSLESLSRALRSFPGVHRRFERLGTFQGADVVDDYAHHPAEIEATLRAARQVFPDRKITAVFQPHLFSRTRDLATEFGTALLLADRAWVTEVYPSRERPIPGVTAQLIVEAARAAGHREVALWRDWKTSLDPLSRSGKGEVILVMGAGDISTLAHRLVALEAEDRRRVVP